MRRVSGRIGPVLMCAVAIGLLAGDGSAQQRGAGVGADKRFSQGTELVQLDFKDVELAVVIETIARITGQNFIYDDRVRGRVTIISPSEVTVAQAFAVFESVLKIKGFTAVPGPGEILKIVPVRDAKESSINIIKDDRPSPNRDTFVTRLVPLLYIDAEAITNTIKPLVSKDASMVAYAPTNTIILTDTEANIRRLLSILEAIDVKTYKEELVVIKVEYADATTLAEQISEIYGADVSSTGVKTSSASRARRSSSSRRTTTTPATAPGSPQSKVRIMTDERTNSLLILASRTSVEEIRELVRKLDIPLIGGGRIHVYYLKYADSEELSKTLSDMLSGQSRSTATPGRTGSAGGQPQNLRSQVTALAEGITLSADPSTNSLVIQASKEAYEALVAVIRKLDIPRPQVLVEALIVEVDITDTLDLGLEWTVNAINGNEQFFFSTAGAAVGSAPEIASFIQNNIIVDDEGNAEAGQNARDYNAVIKAKADDTKFNIVSAPHILTSDNEEAEIRIGDNIPIITSRVNSATGNTAGLSSSVNIERHDTGVTLRVTPQISEGDTLRLKIFQEVTKINKDIQADVGDSEQVGVALRNRAVENTVVVKDGETVVIGGLISDDWNDSESKVPFLGDIPGLGWAFKSNSKELRKQNLLIFLTPHIIRDMDEMEYEAIRKREEFGSNVGQRFEVDPETLETDQQGEDSADTRSYSPVLDAMRDHARRYPLRRKFELEEQRREEEAKRLAEQQELDNRTAPNYGLSIKFYQDEIEAAHALTELLDAGYEGTIVSGDRAGRLAFELRVGPYTDLEKARNVSKLLSQVYGYSPTITVSELRESVQTEPESAEKK